MKDILDRIIYLGHAITRLERAGANALEAATSTTGGGNGMPAPKGVPHSKVERVLDSVQADTDAADLRVELRALRRRVAPYIELMPAGVMRAVATARYLHGTPVPKIARRYRYTPRRVYQLLDAVADLLTRNEAAQKDFTAFHKISY